MFLDQTRVPYLNYYYNSVSVTDLKTIKFYANIGLYSAVKYVLYAHYLKLLWKARYDKIKIMFGDFSMLLINLKIIDQLKHIPSLFLLDKHAVYLVDTSSKHINIYKKFQYYVKDIRYINLKSKSPKDLFRIIKETLKSKNVNL